MLKRVLAALFVLCHVEGNDKPPLLSHRDGFAVSDFLLAASAVVYLFLRCCPAAVIRAVTLVIVNSVNAQIVSVPMRECPIPKSYKIVEPFRTDGYTTASVIFISFSMGVVTTIFHSAPYPIKARFFASTVILAIISSTVNPMPMPPYGQFMPIAPTTVGISSA